MNLVDKYKLALSLLKKSQKILIVSHVSPDPDALASISAFIQLAQLFDKEYYAFATGKPEFTYDFISFINEIKAEKPSNLDPFDLIIILDCGSLDRSTLEHELLEIQEKKKINKLSRPVIIELDHHQPIQSKLDLEIRLSDRASTTEIIYEFLQANNLELTKTMATSLLIGLIADTGNFLYPNASSQALTVASELLLKGASLRKLGTLMKGKNSLLLLQVWGEILATLKLDPNTKLAIIALTDDTIKRLELENKKDLISPIFGDIVSQVSYLEGVDVALFLRDEDNQVKGSFRANNSQIDVSKLASLFGGGGHKRAAGFKVKGRLEETETGWKIVNY